MKKILFAAVLLLGALSCTEVDKNLGGDFIATDEKYDIYEAEFPLTEIYDLPLDSLTGYSSRRMTIGSIRDETYGLYKRSCALSIVPVVDSIDFGTDPVYKSMRFQVTLDSISVEDESQRNILQSVNVYPLTKALDSTNYTSRSVVEYDQARISKNIPVLNGSDTLVFYFTDDFGKRFLDITNDDLKDMDTYLSRFPGIYVTTDDPSGNGGRINMFSFNLFDVSEEYGMLRTDNYAILYYNSEFDGERKDSSLMFYFSPVGTLNLDSLVNNAGETPSQYVLNLDSHETDWMAGQVTDKIYVEGGSGLKPVIPSDEIKSLVTEDIQKNGGDPSTTIITKATIVMPFEFPEDYTTMFRYPVQMSPTVRINRQNRVSFAGLTDASVSTENQGDINRSTCVYAPDITHHVQEIIRTADTTDMRDYDVWLMCMASETNTTYNSEASDLASYYQQLSYLQYYQQLYYGGYSGYGGYYNNYYNYYNMLAAYQNSQATQTSVVMEMDRDRYYRAILNGPEASNGRVPLLKVTYAIPKR